MTFTNSYLIDHEEEPTYLNPDQTSITIDGWLQDTDNIQIMNGYLEFEFTFNPKTMWDDQMLMEHLEEGKKMLNYLKPRWSRKEPKLHHLDKKKQIVCNQLFAPKLNIQVDNPEELINRTATITLHLRDDPMGEIYLNASYVNVHPKGEPKTTMMELVNDGDVLEGIDF